MLHLYAFTRVEMGVLTRVEMGVFTRVEMRALTLGVTCAGVIELATIAFLVAFKLLSKDFF